MTNKKSFKTELSKPSGAAASYISVGSQAQGVSRSDNTERKSKRLNLLIKPSIYEDLKKISVMKQVSINELINTALEGYAADQRELINKYKTTFETGD